MTQTTSLEKLWVEKYRPSDIAGYIFQNPNHKVKFLRMVADQTIPHLLLSGSPGTGKTTLARILISEMNVDQRVDVLTIKASDTNSVDMIRNTIKDHIQTMAMGEFKIIHLEEADYLSLSAQAVLRSLMEDYEETARFILTCNYAHKLMPAIRSRCHEYEFKTPDEKSLKSLMVKILNTESVSYTPEALDDYIAVGYPDVRKVIQLLQENSIDGKLLDPSASSVAGDYKFELLDLLKASNWGKIRTLLCTQVCNDEWEDVYRFLYEHLQHCFTGDVFESGIVIIAEHLYRHSICADPEINAAAMLIRLGGLNEHK